MINICRGRRIVLILNSTGLLGGWWVAAPLCSGNKCQVSQQQPGCSKVEPEEIWTTLPYRYGNMDTASSFTQILNATLHRHGRLRESRGREAIMKIHRKKSKGAKSERKKNLVKMGIINPFYRYAYMTSS